MAEQPKEPKSGDGSPEKNTNVRVEVDKAYFDKLEEAAYQLPDVQETLKKAEHTIIELKKIAKKDKVDEVDDDDLASLVKKQVEDAIAPLKQALDQGKEKKDETIEKLQKAHQTIEELKVSLIASKTSQSSGGGSNQDRNNQPTPEPELTPQEREILARRGIDPKTVKL